MIHNLLQPLKLQFISQYKIYIGNFVLALVCAIVFRFTLNNNLFNLFTIIIVMEIIYSFFIGLFNFSIIGKTYYSLKHDRRLFILSSIIVNILNAFLLLILFIVLNILIGSKISITNLLLYFLVSTFAYSLGCVYSLFISKYRIANIIILIIIIMVIIIFSVSFKDYLINNVNQLFYGYSALKFTFKTSINIIIYSILLIGLNIITGLKYNITYNK